MDLQFLHSQFHQPNEVREKVKCLNNNNKKPKHLKIVQLKLGIIKNIIYREEFSRFSDAKRLGFHVLFRTCFGRYLALPDVARRD